MVIRFLELVMTIGTRMRQSTEDEEHKGQLHGCALLNLVRSAARVE